MEVGIFISDVLLFLLLYLKSHAATRKSKYKERKAKTRGEAKPERMYMTNRMNRGYLASMNHYRS